MKYHSHFLFLKFLLLVCFGIFLIPKQYAQCTVDAGKDTAICLLGDPVNVPLMANVRGGTAPYTFKWTFKDSLSPRLVFTASDFLDDTTSQNPTVIEGTIDAIPLVLVVEVTDADSNVCRDTITVYFSQYIYLPDLKVAYIEAGQSVELYSSYYGGLPPLQYTWSHGYSMDDSTISNPTATPLQTTFYFLIIKDSIGCEVTDNFYVFVSPTGVDPKELSGRVRVFPNPVVQDDLLIIELLEPLVCEFQMYNLNGTIVLRKSLSKSRNAIDLTAILDGTYVYKIFSKTGLEMSGKITKL